MTDNLPPLPPCAPEFKPRWPNDPGGYTADQMKAYARAALAAAPQPQPAQEPVAWSERIKELADQYAIECVEFSKGIPNGAHSMSPIAVKAGDTRLALHSAIETAERFIRAIESATLAAQVERATQPQPVQPQGPMAETAEEAASDVAKCLNERDGQGLDLRHVAMLVNYVQQPVQQEPVLFIHPETYAMASAHVGAWRPGHELPGYLPLYTSPQAPQPLTDEQIDTLRLATGYAAGILRFTALARAIEAAHGITKGTT